MDYPDMPNAAAMSTSAPDSSPLAAYNNFFTASQPQQPESYNSNASSSAYTNASISLAPSPSTVQPAANPMSASTPSYGLPFAHSTPAVNSSSSSSEDLVAKLQSTNEVVRKLQEARQSQPSGLASSPTLAPVASSSSSSSSSSPTPVSGEDAASTELLEKILSEMAAFKDSVHEHLQRVEDKVDALSKELRLVSADGQDNKSALSRLELDVTNVAGAIEALKASTRAAAASASASAATAVSAPAPVAAPQTVSPYGQPAPHAGGMPTGYGQPSPAAHPPADNDRRTQEESDAELAARLQRELNQQPQQQQAPPPVQPQYRPQQQQQQQPQQYVAQPQQAQAVPYGSPQAYANQQFAPQAHQQAPQVPMQQQAAPTASPSTGECPFCMVKLPMRDLQPHVEKHLRDGEQVKSPPPGQAPPSQPEQPGWFQRMLGKKSNPSKDTQQQQQQQQQVRNDGLAPPSYAVPSASAAPPVQAMQPHYGQQPVGQPAAQQPGTYVPLYPPGSYASPGGQMVGASPASAQSYVSPNGQMIGQPPRQ